MFTAQATFRTIVSTLHILITVAHLQNASANQPNIIVIMADDLGWNDVGFHGSNQIPTPNIDALAYSGIILNRHYTLPACSPSRSAFLTGRYPIRQGMQAYPLKAGEPRGIPLTEVLLPQKLKDLGYSTHLIGKWHVGSYKSDFTPTKRGFDTYFGYYNGYVDYFDHSIVQDNFTGHDMHRNLVPDWEKQGQYATRVFTEEAVQVIEKHDVTKPLFLLLSHLAVHSGNDTNLLQVPELTENQERFSYIADNNRRLFAGMVHELDTSTGVIVKTLMAKDMLNNSIILFLSDNGAPTIGMHPNYGSNWPLRGLKFTLFEGGVRTVCILWSQKLYNPGRVSTQLIHLSDWLPTLYSAAGGNRNDLSNLDGVDQWSSLTERDRLFPRTELLLNINNVFHTESYIYRNWKLISGSFKHGIHDYYYGENGRDSTCAIYNTSKVLNSEVGKALNILNPNTIMGMTENISKIRKDSEATCLVNETSTNTGGPFCRTICLFDLERDPCESNNVAEQNQDIVNHIQTLIESYRNGIVLQPKPCIDPASNPAFYNNSWVPWMDFNNTVKEAFTVIH